MTEKSFNASDVELIITSFEKQASKLFKVVILLAISNALFMYLYFACPQNVSINLAQDKTNYSDQTVNR